MKFADVIDPRVVAQISDVTAIGVDIGSRAAKAVLLHRGQLFAALVPTGINMQSTAEELLEELLEEADVPRDRVEYIVGAGYGRVALRFAGIPTEIVTEISCHAMGPISSTRIPGRSSTSAARTRKSSGSIPRRARSRSSS